MNEANSRPLGRTILAGLVLLVAVWLLFKFVLGFVVWLASVVVVVLAVGALIWALRTLF